MSRLEGQARSASRANPNQRAQPNLLKAMADYTAAQESITATFDSDIEEVRGAVNSRRASHSFSHNGHSCWILFKVLTGGKPALDHSHNRRNLAERSRMGPSFQAGQIEHQNLLAFKIASVRLLFGIDIA